MNKLFYVAVLCSLIAFPAKAELSTSRYEKALLAYQQHEYEEAYIHVKNVLQEDPDNLPAKILIGKLFLRNGLFEEAETEFDEANRLGADLDLIIDDWGKVLLVLREFEKIEALEPTDKLSDQGRISLFLIKASSCMYQTDYTCAASTYKTILSFSPDNLQALNGLATVALVQKEFDEAIQYLDKVLSIDEEQAQAWRLKGQVAKATGDLPASLSYLSKAFKLAPLDHDISRSLVDAFIAVQDYDTAFQVSNDILQQSPDDLYVQFANTWLNSKKLNKEASSDLEALSVRLRGLADASLHAEPTLLYLRGIVDFMRGKYALSLKDLSEFVSKSDEDINARILLAKNHVAMGKHKTALSVLKQDEKELSGSLRNGLFLGELYLHNNRQFKAIPLLDKLAKAYPNSADVKLFEVKLAISRGRIEQGLAGLESLIAAVPGNRQVLTTHALIHLQLGEVTKALESIRRLEGIEGAEVDVLNLQVALHIMQKDYQQALVILERILTQQPETFSARFNKANVYSQLGEYERALEILVELKGAAPEHVDTQVLYAKNLFATGAVDESIELFSLIVREKGDYPPALQGLVIAFKAQHRFPEAIKNLKKLIKTDPNRLEYLIQKAQIEIKMAQPEKALLTIDTLAGVVLENWQGLLALSQLQLAIDKNSEAAHSLEKAHAIVPDNFAVHIQWVKILIATGQVLQADAQLKKLERLYPESAEVAFKRAEWFESQGQIQSAASHYIAVLELVPDHELSLARLFSLIAKGGHAEQFVAQAQTMVDAYPERYFPRSLLAQYHFYFGESETAIHHYEFLLNNENYPDKAALLNRLAVLYLPSDLNKSAELSEQAFSLDPTDAGIADSYGWILNRQGKLDESLRVLRDAGARDTSNPAIRYHLADTLLKLNRVEQARALLDSLIAGFPGFEQREEARRLRESLDR